MITSWITDLVYMLGELARDAGWYIFFWIRYNYDERVKYWKRIQQNCLLIADKISRKADDVVTIVEDWAKDRYDWFKGQIGPLWDSIVAVWARFGAGILDGEWTVVSWTEDKTTAVTQWVLSTYEKARKWATDAWIWVSEKGSNAWEWISTKAGSVWDWISIKAGSVWDWISIKSGSVWDWIIGTGDQVESWQIAYGPFYSDLKDTHQNKLLSFLNDPGRFIADWVADLAEYIVSECVWRFW